MEEMDEYFYKKEGFKKFLRIAYAMSTFTIMFVLVRAWGEMMPTHSYFYSVSWAIGFVPMFFLLFLLVRHGLKKPRCVLDSSWPMIKQSVFIAFTFAINYWGVSTSAPHVSGPVQVLISQTPILFAILFSAIIYRRNYGYGYFGIFLVIVALVLQGLLEDKNKGNKVPWGWYLVFFLGNFPNAIWAVAFEGFHKAKSPIDNQYNTMELRMLWTNLWLVFILFFFIPLFGVLNQPSFSNFFPDFWTATVCVFTGSGGYPNDDCKNARWILFLTIPIASLQAHSQVILSRDDTGLFAILALPLATFAADLIFPFKFFMGKYVDTISYWDGISAIICFTGVIIFSISEYYQHRNTQKDVDESSIIKWFTSLDNYPKFLRKCFSSSSLEERRHLISNE